VGLPDNLRINYSKFIANFQRLPCASDCFLVLPSIDKQGSNIVPTAEDTYALSERKSGFKCADVVLQCEAAITIFSGRNASQRLKASNVRFAARRLG